VSCLRVLILTVLRPYTWAEFSCRREPGQSGHPRGSIARPDSRYAFGRQLHLPGGRHHPPYEPRDAADLADVFFRSVRQVALSAYTADQVRAWAPEPRTAGHGRSKIMM
jgi:hypothetical protein